MMCYVVINSTIYTLKDISGNYFMGDIYDKLDIAHIENLKTLQKDLEKQGRFITQRELLKALIEFVFERKNAFINSLTPNEDKPPLDKWLDKIISMTNEEKNNY